jgi:hypothetical protein
MIRAQILDAARQAVTVDRAAAHGAPEDTFGLIARLWSARLGVGIPPPLVCLMLIDLKTARAQGNPGHADNWVDIAGYAACGAEVAGAAVLAVSASGPVASASDGVGGAV